MLAGGTQAEAIRDLESLDLGARALGSQAEGGCDLTIMLFAQPFADSVAPVYLFPINALRNYAALMVRG